jgi:hypothetical protein
MTILWGSLADSSWICRKHENDEKVTGSQDDDLVGVLQKNIRNQVRAMGLLPGMPAL